ncbi:MAG: AI-2E family transporter [Candidatus Uhrbacteria bacterium]|nr:AI-2E family transporter [Candidatus Uhrbacteria bacterium]
MHTPRLQYSFLLIMLGLALFVGFVLFRPFLAVLAVAAMAAVVVYPIKDRIKAITRLPQGMASFLTVLVVGSLILTPVAFLGYRVFTEAADLLASLSANRDAYLELLERVFLGPIRDLMPGVSIETETYLRQALSVLTSNLGRVFSGTVEVVGGIFLFLIAFYYFLKDGPRFVRSFVELSPLSDRYDLDVLDRMALAINSMVRGQLSVALIQGLLTGLGFWMFGVPNPALWGSLAAVCALIPGFGTSLVLVPGIVYLFATNQLWQGAGLFVWGGLAVGLIDNLLGPTLIGRGAKIHPLFVLFAVLGGLALYGPLGFLLGPLTISLLFALLDIYRILVLKEHPILTEKTKTKNGKAP